MKGVDVGIQGLVETASRTNSTREFCDILVPPVLIRPSVLWDGVVGACHTTPADHFDRKHEVCVGNACEDWHTIAIDNLVFLIVPKTLCASSHQKALTDNFTRGSTWSEPT